MSMLKPTLHDFIATVPSCEQANSIAVVQEIFSQGQCDRLVMLQQQCPVGVLQLRRLMPLLMSVSENEITYLQQPISALDVNLVEPIATLPADLSVEQFKLYLHSQPDPLNTKHDLALVDSNGKFLGMLQNNRLWKFLSSTASSNNQQQQPIQSFIHKPSVEPWRIDLLVQLLEKLPLPLMVETGRGEVVTQNPAWCEQLGFLSNGQAVRQEVEAILNNFASPAEVKSQQSQDSKNTLNLDQENSTTSYCQSGTQPGTCICVLSGENGIERVWQFAKILLPMSVVSSQVDNEQIWLLLANDITQQQQLAAELAAKNADLIHLNRLKDEFLSCISHELKTPLTAVLGLSTLLKDQTFGQLNERQVRYARLIHESGRHLMSVVNDILDLTRMETGQLELTLEPVQIKTVCDRAIEQARAMQSKAGEHMAQCSLDHHFTLLIEPGLESLMADELRLRQMLIHLLSNAFKFTHTGGEIGLQVSRWEGWIAFTVWDTGIGIPEHQQNLIFQKFQQLENPLTRQFEGTGLGLVLTRTLVRLHGGDVSFLSKEGKGSQFTLLLPPNPPNNRLGEQEISPLTPRPSPQRFPSFNPTIQNRRNRLVLVVEAAPRLIEGLTEQLTLLGYRVVVARSGTEALEKARKLQPGAIFLNPLLPLLSGWDVLTLLKSDTVTSQIPVIVHATLAEKEQALASRADEFLSLPVHQQVLQQMLSRFCNQPSSELSNDARANKDEQLTILRLVTPHTAPFTSYPSSLNYRILESDDLEQAAIVAKIWQPDVLLLDAAVSDPLTYLQQLAGYPSLAGLSIVTLDAATTQAANQITKLSVFPCITPAQELTIDALLSVLQVAAGMGWKQGVSVVDVATLLAPEAYNTEQYSSVLPGAKTSLLNSLRSEWFQALIQYLAQAGLRGVMARSWDEVKQQIQQQSVDLLLICVGESWLASSVLIALTDLIQQHNLPPVLVLDQRCHQGEVREQFPHHLETDGEDSTPTSGLSRQTIVQNNSIVAVAQSDTLESLETVLGAIATQILPSSLSMEELLDQIHQTLKSCGRR